MQEVSKDVENMDLILAVREYMQLHEHVLAQLRRLTGPRRDTALSGKSETALSTGKESVGDTKQALILAFPEGSGGKLDDVKAEATLRLVKHGLLPNASQMSSSFWTNETAEKFMRAECESILRRYLDTGAEAEVNIPGECKRALVQALRDNHNYDPSVFDKAVEQVKKNIVANDLTRFLQHATTSNIGDVERTKRLHKGIGDMILFVLVNAVLLYFHLNNFFRLATGPIGLYACIFFAQYRARFCVRMKLGNKAAYYDNPEEAAQVVLETCVLQDHKARSQQVWKEGIIGSAILLGITVALPPWNFSTLL